MATPTKGKTPPQSKTRSRRSKATSSPNAARSVERLRPHTLDHFRYWASLTTLDNGLPWELEDFQREILADVFAGFRETLAVLPTGSYKTTTFGGFGLYHLQFTPSAQVPVGASSKQQAGILYEQAAGFIHRSRFLQARFRVQDGYRRIGGQKGTPFQGRILRVYAASDDTGDGVIPTLALIDELHRHKGHNLYGTWRDKLTKRDGQMVTLSTAGDSEDNPLEELRDAARKLRNAEIVVDGRHTIVRSNDRAFTMHEWALTREDDCDDLKVVKMANPASQVTLDELRKRRDSPSTKMWQWERFTCNRRAKGEDGAIEPEEWDARLHQGLHIPLEVPVWVGLDLGWKIDHAALTPVAWENDMRRLIAGAVTLAPPVEEDEVVLHLLRMWETLNVVAVVYDPNAGGAQMVQQLERGEHRLQTNDAARREVGLPPLENAKGGALAFVEHSQDNSPMSLAAARFDEALQRGWFRQDGHSKCTTAGCRCGGLRGHVLNAISRPLGGEKWKYDRPGDAKGRRRAKYPIDGLTGGLMAHSVAVAEGGVASRLNIGDYRIHRV